MAVNVIMFTACNHNGKHEVDQPGTKATTGLHISVKIVRANSILSVKTFYGPLEFD